MDDLNRTVNISNDDYNKITYPKYTDDITINTMIKEDIEEIKEGGENDFVFKFPKMTKYGNLILKRGLTYSTGLYDWFSKIYSLYL